MRGWNRKRASRVWLVVPLPLIVFLLLLAPHQANLGDVLEDELHNGGGNLRIVDVKSQFGSTAAISVDSKTLSSDEEEILEEIRKTKMTSLDYVHPERTSCENRFYHVFVAREGSEEVVQFCVYADGHCCVENGTMNAYKLWNDELYKSCAFMFIPVES